MAQGRKRKDGNSRTEIQSPTDSEFVSRNISLPETPRMRTPRDRKSDPRAVTMSSMPAPRQLPRTLPGIPCAPETPRDGNSRTEIIKCRCVCNFCPLARVRVDQCGCPGIDPGGSKHVHLKRKKSLYLCDKTYMEKVQTCPKRETY